MNWENGFPSSRLEELLLSYQFKTELVISSAIKSLQSMGNKLVWLQESDDMPIARYKCLMMATTTG